VIIPAMNEAATLGAVIAAARRTSTVERVIVIDDHSDDDTADVARRAGAEVLTSRGKRSKALAMATGVEASSSPFILFFDGDITSVEPHHFDQLAAPVIDGHFAMCCGVVDYGSLRNPLFLRLPPITGLRAVRREIFTAIPEPRLSGFQIEIMINEVIARGEMPTAIRVLDGVRHRSKVKKLGVLRGSLAHASMTAELLHCFTFVPLWTYRSYLRNLTVLAATAP
jgi:polyisoprenyl-phosphate glycosyltransferase